MELWSLWPVHVCEGDYVCDKRARNNVVWPSRLLQEGRCRFGGSVVNINAGSRNLLLENLKSDHSQAVQKWRLIIVTVKSNQNISVKCKLNISMPNTHTHTNCSLPCQGCQSRWSRCRSCWPLAAGPLRTSRCTSPCSSRWAGRDESSNTVSDAGLLDSQPQLCAASGALAEICPNTHLWGMR